MDFHAGWTGSPPQSLSLSQSTEVPQLSRRSIEFERGGLGGSASAAASRQPRQRSSELERVGAYQYQRGSSPPLPPRRSPGSQELARTVSRDLTEFPRDVAPVFKGYLFKQGKSQLLRRWQRRYFVLFPGFLMYWPEERDFVSRKKPKGFVDLR